MKSKLQKTQSRAFPVVPLFDLQIASRTKRLVAEVLESGWLSTGAVATRLEEEIKKKFGLSHVAAVSSATAGLIASLKAVGVQAGDEVIIPSFTFIATAEAVHAVGATVRFADIDSRCWTLDPASVKTLINKRTRAIIPVDFAGVPADYLKLRPLARSHDLSLVSDSSHALDATLRSKSISEYTDFSVISLHVTKNLTAAEGGLVISAKGKDDQQIRLLSRHGITRNAWQRRGKGSVEYDVIANGLKGNLPDILAAVALGELGGFAVHQRQRTRLATRYLRNLKPFEKAIQPIFVPDQAMPSWHLFPVMLTKVRTKKQRDAVLESLKFEGIECGIHYRPLHTMSLFRTHPDRTNLPVTDVLGRSILVLPLYPLLKPEQIDWISERLVHTLIRLKLL